MSWPEVVDALSRIEGVAPEECGMLSSEDGGGGIFVERGRICWAAAPGMQQRLTDLLRTSALHDVDLDLLYQRCRAEGRPLGQTLVDEGWMAPRELETVLRRHTAESLVELCREGVPLEIWSSRGAEGYAARFTFRPLDVLLDVAELYLPHVQDVAYNELAEFDRPDRRGGAFYVNAALDSLAPLAAFGEQMSVGALVELGTWAMAVLGATRELGTTSSLTLAGRADGAAAVVWSHAPLLYVVACRERYDAAEIAIGHAARRSA